MTDPERELAERIRGETVDLDRSVARASAAWERGGKAGTEQDYYLDAVALNLHSFYSGIERLFELTARHIDHTLPDGEAWHRVLVTRMAQEVPDVRPAVISPDVAATLDEYRRFRHLVRNVYATNLVPAKMQGLVERLATLWPRLRVELIAFAGFLEQISSDAT
ncbi:MAG: antitoxin [Chloroflexi bacterium]|nr:antitoxin [Chloroflexota bacterium]